jgi:hypothetical protein
MLGTTEYVILALILLFCIVMLTTGGIQHYAEKGLDKERKTRAKRTASFANTKATASAEVWASEHRNGDSDDDIPF